ncbi:Mor transcription activator family protein [Kineothrix sedimenti]|uniref:Mor transcription activator family protein n=1 Tax=Kineothrix sedimenti TaxID=3123317 RepID=A0ABZ3F082_9FIRM
MSSANMRQILSDLHIEEVLYKLTISDRDKEIVKKFMTGNSMAALAREYNLSAQRIRAIILYCKRHVVWKRYKE